MLYSAHIIKQGWITPVPPVSICSQLANKLMPLRLGDKIVEFQQHFFKVFLFMEKKIGNENSRLYQI